ncbi:MAG: CbtA family protein [Paracoccaceae bacterium]
MVTSALFAGCAAGLFTALLHFAFVQKYILLGEEYETGALVHFGGVDDAAATNGHTHNHTVEEASDTGVDAAEEAAGSDMTRNGLTVLFWMLTYSGFGLLLTAAFATAEQFGRSVTARDGILWGLAGFVALQLAPAIGLAPELPGTMAADLAARQIWWAGTVLATAAGLAGLAYGRGFGALVLGCILLAAPHLIGAPELEGFSGVAPPEVASAFSARVLAVGFAGWAVLGMLAARFWSGKAG